MPQMVDEPHSHNRFYPEPGVVKCALCGQEWAKGAPEPECTFDDYVIGGPFDE